MAVEAPLWTMLKDVSSITFTDGSGTPIVYTFRIAQDTTVTETVKRQADDVIARDNTGVPVGRRKGPVARDPMVVIGRPRLHSHSLGSTVISTTAGSLVALVRGTGPTSWTNTDSARQPDHVTGTLAIVIASVGGAMGETRSYAKAAIQQSDLTEETDMNGRFLPSLTFVCLDEPTITVNTP